MKFAHKIMRFAKTKQANKLLAAVIILAVIAIGFVVIATRASAPYGQTTATSGTLAGNASIASNTGAANGTYVQFNTSTSGGGGNCASATPANYQYTGYSETDSTVFTGSSRPSDLQSYGNEQFPGGGGFYMDNHIVMEGNYLQIQGYNDTESVNNTVVGAGFDMSNSIVKTTGGYDVCMSLSKNSWNSGVQWSNKMVDLTWPTNDGCNGGCWGDGENDFFEGPPSSPGINLHPIGCGNNCGNAVFGSSYPASAVDDAQPHLVSAFWNNGTYTYSLDGKQYASYGYTMPTAEHHLSLQMQDAACVSPSSSCNNIPKSSMDWVNIYWISAYNPS